MEVGLPRLLLVDAIVIAPIHNNEFEGAQLVRVVLEVLWRQTQGGEWVLIVNCIRQSNNLPSDVKSSTKQQL